MKNIFYQAISDPDLLPEGFSGALDIERNPQRPDIAVVKGFVLEIEDSLAKIIIPYVKDQAGSTLRTIIEKDRHLFYCCDRTAWHSEIVAYADADKITLKYPVPLPKEFFTISPFKHYHHTCKYILDLVEKAYKNMK